MNEVLSSWGEPSGKMSFGEDIEDWNFHFTGVPQVRFQNQIMDTVRFYLNGCSLEKLIDQLGPPERVEIISAVSCVGGNLSIIQNFHYLALGFSYFRSCNETSGQDCFRFHRDDLVDGKEFYELNKIIQDSTGFNMSTKVYNWRGFDVSLLEVEK